MRPAFLPLALGTSSGLGGFLGALFRAGFEGGASSFPVPDPSQCLDLTPAEGLHFPSVLVGLLIGLFLWPVLDLIWLLRAWLRKTLQVKVVSGVPTSRVLHERHRSAFA